MSSSEPYTILTLLISSSAQTVFHTRLQTLPLPIILARREGLQFKADTVSAFTIIFGIEMAIHNFRNFAKCWGEERSHFENSDYDLITHGPD